MPALLTSTSISPPSWSTAVSQMSRGAAGSVRSPAMRVSLPLVEWPTTLWPCFLSSALAAAPIPRLAPVTRMFMDVPYPPQHWLGRGTSVAAGRTSPSILADCHLPSKKEGRMRSGGDAVHERLGARLEIGDLLGEAAETLLDLVDVLGDIFRVGADRGDGRAHRIRRERGLVDGGGDHRHRLRLQLHRFADSVGRGLHLFDGALDRAVGLDGLLGRLLDRGDLGGDVVGCPRRLRGEALHFLRDDREAAAGISGARGLDR